MSTEAERMEAWFERIDTALHGPPEKRIVECRVLINGVWRVNTYETYDLDCPKCYHPEMKGNPFMQMAYYVGESRRFHHVGGMKVDHEMMGLAQAKADDMFKHQYMDHMDLDGNKPKYSEILTKRDTPWHAFNSWRDSGGHHDIMVHPSFTRCGIGKRGDYWAMQFSR